VKGRLRRGVVILGVVASLMFGVASIQVAADLAAAAAPPPAPPVSMDTLKGQLADEQARAASLQGQLEDLLGATGQLTAAIDSTETQVSDDGLTAAQLRDRLKAAQTKLNSVNSLLKKAQARLAALGQVKAPAPAKLNPPPVTGGTGNNGGGGVVPVVPPTPVPPTPVPPAPAAFALSVNVTGGLVEATWTICSQNNFASYALVRSTDSEIHYPPEDRDTLVASIKSNVVTSAIDATAPSGRLWYRVYCLTGSGGNRVSATTATVRITAP
jgi:hypothetical protein